MLILIGSCLIFRFGVGGDLDAHALVHPNSDLCLEGCVGVGPVVNALLLHGVPLIRSHVDALVFSEADIGTDAFGLGRERIRRGTDRADDLLVAAMECFVVRKAFDSRNFVVNEGLVFAVVLAVTSLRQHLPHPGDITCTVDPLQLFEDLPLLFKHHFVNYYVFGIDLMF